MIKLKVNEDVIRLGVEDDVVKLRVREGMVSAGGVSSIEIGTVTDGTPVSVTNSGTAQHAILDFVIPGSIDYLNQIDTVLLYCGSSGEVF